MTKSDIDNGIYRRLLDGVSDGVVVFGPERQILYCNQAFVEISGFDHSDLENALCGLMQGPSTDPATIAAIDQALVEGREFTGEILNYRKSGETFWNELSFKPVRDDDGKIACFIGYSRDVTERKRAETRVVELQRDYEFIAENVLSGIIIQNPDSTVRYINPKALEMLGIDRADIIGKTAEDRGWRFLRLDGTEMPKEELPFNRALAERQTVRGILLGHHQPGGERVVWALCNAFLAKDQYGEVTAVLVSFTDVSRLIESEHEAAVYRERFELAARASQDVVFEWNITTGQFFANEAFETVYGYAPPEMMGTHNLNPRSAVASHEGIVGQVTLDAIASGKERFAVDHMIARPDGSVGHVVIRAFIVRGPDGTALRVIGTATDVGHLTAALAALEESETCFRIIADMVSDVIWDHNFDTGQSWITTDWAERLNIDVANPSTVGTQWMEHVDPADHDRVLASYRAALASDKSRWEVEYRLIDMHGQKVDVAVKASILRNPDGRAHRMLGNVRDITALKRQQEGHTRSRALEAVGQLTGGVAHDFNNLLMIIQGNAELLAMSPLGEEDSESVELISRASESAATLTRRLLSFAGQNQFDNRCVDIPSFIDGIWPLLRAGLPESIAIRATIAEDMWQPEVDPHGLEQAIVNIAMNASDAMPGGGEIALVCENQEITPQQSADAPGLEPGQYVVLSLRDTGAGMAPGIQARAFEPYFTTKEFGKGTGLGLSTVYGFAVQSGGTATLQSDLGHGTTVKLYLPVCRGCMPEPSAHVENRQIEIVPQQKRILVVEDQPAVRAHVVKLLARLGYAVESADNAVEALNLLDQGPSFDLLYTDIIMPGGMNGQELSKEAKKIAPHIKVLYTSGYPAGAFEHLGLEAQLGINILRKPYKAAQLKEAVADILAD